VLIVSFLSLFKKKKKTDYEPNVSIVVPAYNEQKNIIKCLKSIYGSEYSKDKIEVIVVDDKSKDDTVAYLELFKRKCDPSLIIIKEEHRGKSETLNAGIKAAKYDIIFTVDADTIISKDVLKKLVQPFLDEKVGATNGSCVVRNRNSLLGMFQNIEYHYNNLIKKSFCTLFDNGIWFFGAFACYRKDVLEKIGYFKKHSLTEDANAALEIYSAGYKTMNVHDAYGFVLVPKTIKGFFKQRTRWWIGVLQSLKANKKLLSFKSSPSILFLFFNQYWWSFYSIISLPMIAYHFNYWLPYNTTTFYTFFMYTFRWFTLLGPVHVIYMIPEWGISLYSIFGVLSGLITAFLIIKALYLFKEKIHLKNNIIGIFFYFPYTILLNIVIIISVIRAQFSKKSYFIKN
tara:strand:- start:8746 stop:9945 length:1200 start_codon:yes stop_codon:yes gene_type:complete